VVFFLISEGALLPLLLELLLLPLELLLLPPTDWEKRLLTIAATNPFTIGQPNL
jgi:hypothetical protein